MVCVKNPMNQEIDRILAILQADFQTCYELTETFSNLPNVPGIYAIRHHAEILYIGRAAEMRRRFQKGHKAIGLAFIKDLRASEVRIAVAPVAAEFVRSLIQIEARLIQQIHPPYNVQYPSIED
jgi:excinuclease UvrABC nuclease subunit